MFIMSMIFLDFEINEVSFCQLILTVHIPFAMRHMEIEERAIQQIEKKEQQCRDVIVVMLVAHAS